MKEPNFVKIKIADVWSGHIKRQDLDLLDQQTEVINPDVGVDSFEFGFYVNVPDAGNNAEFEEEMNEILRIGFSQEFVNILRFARDQKCEKVKFDCDGEVYEELPEFEL